MPTARRNDANTKMKNGDGIEAQFLVAERRGRQVALPLADVRGGLPRTGLEAVPGGEPDWLGVLAVRGEIVVALEVDGWLDLDEIDAAPEAGALVLFRAEGTTVALAFDRLRGVVKLATDRLQPHPVRGQKPWLRAMYSDDRYERLDVVDGPALSAALKAGGREAELAS